MVEDFDAEQLAGPDQIPGHADVALAWSGVAAGMVVGKGHRRGFGGDGGAKHLTWMNQDGVQRALSDSMIGNQSASGG